VSAYSLVYYTDLKASLKSFFMKKFLLFLPMLMLLLMGCEQSLSESNTESLSVSEIATLANADENVIRAFDLTSAITDARSEGMLGGATLPDGPGTAILGKSTSVPDLSSYLDEHDFPNAVSLASLYAERNALLEGFRIKYKPMVDQLTDEEKEELNKLLPSTSGKMTVADAVNQLPK